MPSLSTVNHSKTITRQNYNYDIKLYRVGYALTLILAWDMGRMNLILEEKIIVIPI